MRNVTIALAASLLISAAAAQGPTANAQVLAPNHAELENVAQAAGPEGMFALGRSYQLGAGVPINYRQAVQWLQKAADAGHAAAMTTLAMMYGRAAGVPYDKARSDALMERAVVLGDPAALAMSSIRRPEPERTQWMQKALAAGDPFALVMHALDTSQTPERHATRQRAYKVLQALADLGDLDALDWLGSLQQVQGGEPGASLATHRRLIERAERAYQAGNSYAAVQLAMVHFHISVIPGGSSEAVARQWARRAVAAGNPTARDLLGDLAKD